MAESGLDLSFIIIGGVAVAVGYIIYKIFFNRD